jgi:hypothetical protein
MGRWAEEGCWEEGGMDIWGDGGKNVNEKKKKKVQRQCGEP